MTGFDARAGNAPPTQAAFDSWLSGLAECPPQDAGSVIMCLVGRCVDGKPPWQLYSNRANVLRRNWTVTAEDAALVVASTESLPEEWSSAFVFYAAHEMLVRTGGAVAEADVQQAQVRRLIDAVSGRPGLPLDDRRSLNRKLAALLPIADDAAEVSLLDRGDGWSLVAVPLLETCVPAAANAVLRQLHAASGSKPAVGWSKQTSELVADPDAAAVVRILVESLATAEPVTVQSQHGRIPLVLTELNADIARAAVWASSSVAGDWVVTALHSLALRGIQHSELFGWMSGEKVPNACIVVLGQRATPDAVVALQSLSNGTKHSGFRKRIATALGGAAERAGLTPSQLVEQTVPTQGLGPDWSATVTAGSTRATAQVHAGGAVTVDWAGRAKPPADAPDHEVKAVKRAVKELRDAVRIERRRVEGLLAADRVWQPEEWAAHYVDHPLSAGVGRDLLWVFGDVVGMAGDRTVIRTIDGDAPRPDTEVRLWHPATASTEEVSAWRSWLVDHDVAQPFKQAYREVYLLTPAEILTDTYSNRFAAHVLHYQQTYALFKERTWPANYLGPYEGGYDGRARHDFPDAGLTAVFEHGPVDGPPADRVVLATTDRVWFHRTADRLKEQVHLEAVPPLVFSEAMRDIDLFVGVTSIALDPTWLDRGDDPHRGYWLRAASGPLSASAEVRRDVLARVLPKLKVADRVELGDRYVRVRGDRASYRVHIGSANVLIEPDDRYLCIVPSSNGRGPRIMLPFEGDGVLSLVLSKVLLLAADSRITDRSILQQIAPRTG